MDYNAVNKINKIASAKEILGMAAEDPELMSDVMSIVFDQSPESMRAFDIALCKHISSDPEGEIAKVIIEALNEYGSV